MAMFYLLLGEYTSKYRGNFNHNFATSTCYSNVPYIYILYFAVAGSGPQLTLLQKQSVSQNHNEFWLIPSHKIYLTQQNTHSIAHSFIHIRKSFLFPLPIHYIHSPLQEKYISQIHLISCSFCPPFSGIIKFDHYAFNVDQPSSSYNRVLGITLLNYLLNMRHHS